MTEENYQYRTSQQLLRNQFPGNGRWEIPLIPKAEFSEDEFRDLLLIGFDKTKLEDDRHLGRMVHFFLYDYKFERVWKQPDTDIEKLSRYRAVLSPDFSMYLEMAPVMQLYNVFRNRWCGAYWASKGMRVIPTLNWGDESTFEFCFEGVEKGSVVAVSTYMASAHGNSEDQKEWFMAGYNEMLRIIEPEKIICYNTPFPEMQGDIVFVDYDKSSWRHMDEDKSAGNEGTFVRKTGYIILPERDTIQSYQVNLGGGSAYGGKWRPNPNKPQDQRFLGMSDEIKVSYTTKGERIETHIGNDGRADYEIHYTNHGFPKYHEVPHIHEVIWRDTGPSLSKEEYSAKLFNRKAAKQALISYVPSNSFEQNQFNTISDFKWCMKRGGEVQFEWNGIMYCCFGAVAPEKGSAPRMVIAQSGSVKVNTQTEMWCDTADEMLEYMVGSDRLRDVITKVKVWERTF